MNKKQIFDYISEKQDVINEYESVFGNDSWWYSNRSPETCNKVKIYAYVDIDKVLELLSEKQRKQIELLDIDLNTLCNDIAWGDEYNFDMSLVSMYTDDEIEKIKTKYPAVQDITFHGRSGGWACVVYDFNIKTGDGWTIDDVVNNGVDRTEYKTLLDIYEQINKALKTVDEINEYIEKSRKRLCKLLEDPQSYILKALHVIENTYA